MNRPIRERILDRVWVELASRMDDSTVPPESGETLDAGSVSSTMAWPLACAALADGIWQSSMFRRRRAVREVVETLAPSDGRYFARWIMSVRPELFEIPLVDRANNWGDPLQAPSWILGTKKPWSPTSLRYLAHALWMEMRGFTSRNATVVEVGVGYGGLGAMMAAVSGVNWVPMDLPPVLRAAEVHMKELGLDQNIRRLGQSDGMFSFVSNYAFTELSAPLQNEYIETTVRHALKGLILSNASQFASRIGGKDNQQLVTDLRKAGVDASCVWDSPLLGPSDKMFGNCVIQWG